MIAFAAMFAFNIRPLFGTFSEAARHAAFQVPSIMTTTGFATADFNLWPQFSRLLLVRLMAGRVGGFHRGRHQDRTPPDPVKSRAQLRIKGSQAQYRSADASEREHVGRGHHPGNPRVYDALRGHRRRFHAASVAQRLIHGHQRHRRAGAPRQHRPGLDGVGPMGNRSAFLPFSKLVLIAIMLIGRPQILPMLTLFAPSIWKR